MVNINFADDLIRTADLWSWKQLLYQLSHNLCLMDESWILLALIRKILLVYNFGALGMEIFTKGRWTTGSAQ